MGVRISLTSRKIFYVIISDLGSFCFISPLWGLWGLLTSALFSEPMELFLNAYSADRWLNQ